MIAIKKIVSLILAVCIVTVLLPVGFTAFAGTPGTVTNLVTRFNSSKPSVVRPAGVADSSLVVQQGSYGCPLTNYTTSSYPTAQDKINATIANNPYYTSDKSKWLYGDRNPRTSYTGADANNPIYNFTFYTLLDTTSSILLGPNVTKIMAFNSDKDLAAAVSDLYSFDISKPATVYIIPTGTFDTVFVDTYGWTRETSLTAYRPSLTTIQSPSNSKYYSVPTGSSALSTIYSKHFNTGKVNIPSRGATSYNGYIIYVVWDDCNPTATLSDLKVGGISVYHFVPETKTYNVSLPYGTTAGSAGALVSATSTFPGATVSVAQAATLPGSATVTVRAADGITTDIYTINFTVDQGITKDADPSKGSVMFEAEQATLNPSLFGTVSDASASGGSVVSALVNQATAPSSTVSGLEFNIAPDRANPYTVWIRYSASSSQNSLYLSADGSAYTSKALTATGTNPSSYGWYKLYTTGNRPSAGGKFNFKIYPAKAGLRIDKILVTAYPFFTPNGAVTTLDNMAFTYSLPSGAYPMPSITPPADHPRLLLRPSDVTTVKANMQKSQNASAYTSYNNYLNTTTDGKLPPMVVEGGNNYNATTLAIIESYALKYALDGDETYGSRAIAAIKNNMSTVDFTDSAQDITRAMGHTIFVASEVYDWCYPLLTNEDKNFIIVAGEALAKRMETTYPPSGQGAVTGHGGEAQLLRDVLSFGVATYNERPDIYNYIAGRLLSQFVEPRNYWFASHTHYQGQSYGHYRHTWELYFAWIMYRMSGVMVFSPEMEFVPYQWIYTKRPDGQEFRNGDGGTSALGTYWPNDIQPAFLSSNLYGNAYVKNLLFAASPNLNSFSIGNGYLTPVTFLLLNNPDLGPVSHTSTFPLTNYFGSPYGMMVARTGWTEPGTVNFDSNVAMAQMVIGEQWSANHQHLDAGSFQLYYKGALAIDSGVYDSYGVGEDKQYNKETIAHNSLLIYDPNETIFGGAVNSGGQRRPGNELSTFSDWMSKGYDTGKVLDHAYDTNSSVPRFSYIKGDITRAYSNKVSEVLRSMLFMPLSDANHPAALVVMDKVTAANPAFQKTWLLHMQEEPTVSGNTAVIKRDADSYHGRMDLTALLPANPVLTKVGGVGNEFNVRGVNYAPTTLGNSGSEYGEWRIEETPPTANATDYFLNVMQVSDSNSNAAPLPATLIETDTLAGVKISDRVAVFGKNKARMGGVVQFSIPGAETGGLKIMVAGIAEGSWNIYKGTNLVGSSVSTADGGNIYFDGGAGDYRLVQVISSVSLNTPSNLNQTFGAVGAVSFTATPTPASGVDLSAIEWYVNGVKQATTGTAFTYTPVDAGTYIVAVNVSNNPGATGDFKTIVVKNAAQAPPSIAVSKTYNTVTITPVAGAEYGLKLKGSADEVVYKSGNVFTGLVPNTQYTAYIRLAAKQNYDASPAVNADVKTDNYIPNAPNVTADDVANTIVGLDLQTMEVAVSTDGGNTFGGYSSGSVPFLGGSKVVKVRIKASGGTGAGGDAILTFTPNFGDIDGGGVIDVSDVIMAAEIAVGNTSYTGQQILRANVSDKIDMTVDIADVVLIAERVVGNTTLFPAERP